MLLLPQSYRPSEGLWVLSHILEKAPNSPSVSPSDRSSDRSDLPFDCVVRYRKADDQKSSRRIKAEGSMHYVVQLILFYFVRFQYIRRISSRIFGFSSSVFKVLKVFRYCSSGWNTRYVLLASVIQIAAWTVLGRFEEEARRVEVSREGAPCTQRYNFETCSFSAFFFTC